MFAYEKGYLYFTDFIFSKALEEGLMHFYNHYSKANKVDPTENQNENENPNENENQNKSNTPDGGMKKKKKINKTTEFNSIIQEKELKWNFTQ